MHRAIGLAALHRASLPHGLLHPDAILVERHRDRPFARLGLPGVAGVVFRILREGGSITTTGASLGSTAFQSPEQLRSPARGNLQSDLFALGCLLYYLLAGKSPFQGLDPLSAYEASRTETYPPLADRASVSIHVYGANIGAVRRHVYDPGTGQVSAFVSGYSNAVIPNVWDRSTETTAAG